MIKKGLVKTAEETVTVLLQTASHEAVETLLGIDFRLSDKETGEYWWSSDYIRACDRGEPHALEAEPYLSWTDTWRPVPGRCLLPTVCVIGGGFVTFVTEEDFKESG